MEKLFKEYCEIKQLNEKYGRVILDANGIKCVETLSGNKIYQLEYGGRRFQPNDDIYYSISHAVCSGKESNCSIGNPSPACVEAKMYSVDKCAVLYLNEVIDFAKYNYTLNKKQLESLTLNSLPTNKDIQKAFPIQEDWSKEDKYYELGKIRGAEWMLSTIMVRLSNGNMYSEPSREHKTNINPQDIIEKNRLIAEFMGTPNDLALYHNNWSWLMPVVDKIEAIKSYGCEFYFVEITKLHISIRGTTQGIYRKVEDGDKLTATWLSVVDFIKWHNEK